MIFTYRSNGRFPTVEERDDDVIRATKASLITEGKKTPFRTSVVHTNTNNLGESGSLDVANFQQRLKGEHCSNHLLVGRAPFPKQQQNMINNKNKETEKETERETYSSTGTFSSAKIKFVKNFQMWGVRWATAFRPSPMKLEPVVAVIIYLITRHSYI
jgi:hypothetical protein